MSAPSAQPAPPPGPPSAPPSGSVPPRFQRSHVVTQDATTAASPPKPPQSQSAVTPEHAHRSRHSSKVANEDAAAAQQQQQQQQQRQPPQPPAPEGLKASDINKAFGQTGAENTPTRRKSGFITPTTKDGNDAVSMYSLSQSILPVDPRDRLYYRPRRHLLQCYVDRKKSNKDRMLRTIMPGKNCIYSFHLEHTNDFVISAEPRPTKGKRTVADDTDGIAGQGYEVKQGPGNVLFSINEQNMDDIHSFVGKLSRRGGGEEMVMFSEGSIATRKEIAAILMETSADGQRRFKVILPAIDAETGFLRPVEGGEVRFLRDGRGTSVAGGSRAGLDAALNCSSDDEVDETLTVSRSQAPTFKPALDDNIAPPPNGKKKKKWQTHSCLVKEYLRAGIKSPNIIVLQNKAPKWDSTLRGYQLDFHGRATKASEKNFQLVASTDVEKVVMLFGKQSDDRYSVDFRFPLCGLQAAAIAAAMMEIKIITR